MNPAEPLFVTRAQIERLHDLSVARFGGSAGIRDEALIDSALAAAKNTFFYGNGDVFDIAAAYAFHIAQAQAFNDANKRTGIGAALTFLKLNGINAIPDHDMLFDAMIAIANNQLDKLRLAGIFRQAAASGD